MVIDWLINRAKRTPYYDLPGYMERYWLVPYSKRIRRSLPRRRDGFVEIVTDGTGPVGGFRPIARLLQRFDIAVRIHHILRSDRGRDPHDHPWPFITVILRGGYFETLYDDEGFAQCTKWHGAGSILFRRAEQLHRLMLAPGETAWTLFITGRKTPGSWGFKPVGEPKIPHYEYEGEA
jgi:hypothetical protein